MLSEEQLASLETRLKAWFKGRMEIIGSQLAVIGISGGKDSSVVAALAVSTLGQENVIGVLMPRGQQNDLDVAVDLCQHLGIRHEIVDVGPACEAVQNAVLHSGLVPAWSRQSDLNLPPRIRMSVLYGVAQSVHGVVINTSNLSEDWVGYATIYGDTCGAFSPLATLTTAEVIALGRHLGLPERFILKPPADGLTGQTDEDVLGFSYETLNRYIRTGVCEDEEVRKRIDHLHRISRFKFQTIPMFDSGLPIVADDIAVVYRFPPE